MNIWITEDCIWPPRLGQSSPDKNWYSRRWNRLFKKVLYNTWQNLYFIFGDNAIYFLLMSKNAQIDSSQAFYFIKRPFILRVA